MAINYRDVDNIPKIIEIIEELNSKELQIGIFAPEGSEFYLIAMSNEYGSTKTVTQDMRDYFVSQGIFLRQTTTEINVPERSFIRAGFDSAKDFIERYIDRALPLVIKLRMTPHEFYSILGESIVGKIHEYVQQLRTPPNSPITIALKGSDHPLIDTGRMTQSITYRVVNK